MPAIAVGTAIMAAHAAAGFRVMAVCFGLAGHQARLEGERQYFAQPIEFVPQGLISEVANRRLHAGVDRNHIGVFEPTANVDAGQPGDHVKPVYVIGAAALEITVSSRALRHSPKFYCSIAKR